MATTGGAQGLKVRAGQLSRLAPAVRLPVRPGSRSIRAQGKYKVVDSPLDGSGISLSELLSTPVPAPKAEVAPPTVVEPPSATPDLPAKQLVATPANESVAAPASPEVEAATTTSATPTPAPTPAPAAATPPAPVAPDTPSALPAVNTLSDDPGPGPAAQADQQVQGSLSGLDTRLQEPVPGLPGLGEGLEERLEGGLTSATQSASKALAATGDAVGGAVDSITEGVGSAVGSLAQEAGQKLGGVTESVSALAQKAGQKLGGVTSGMAGGLDALQQEAGQTLSGVTGSVSALAQEAGQKLSSVSSGVSRSVEVLALEAGQKLDVVTAKGAALVQQLEEVVGSTGDIVWQAVPGPAQEVLLQVGGTAGSVVQLALDNPGVTVGLATAATVPAIINAYNERFAGFSGELEPEAVAGLLAGEEAALLLDIRSEAQREEGGLLELKLKARFKAAALPVSFAEAQVAGMEPAALRQLSNRQQLVLAVHAALVAGLKQVSTPLTRVVVMDAEGSPAARSVARAVRAEGLYNAYVMKSGFQGWQQAQLPVTLSRGISYEASAADLVADNVEVIREQALAVLSRLSQPAVAIPVAGTTALGATALYNYHTTLQVIGLAGLSWSAYRQLSQYDSPQAALDAFTSSLSRLRPPSPPSTTTTQTSPEEEEEAEEEEEQQQQQQQPPQRGTGPAPSFFASVSQAFRQPQALTAPGPAEGVAAGGKTPAGARALPPGVVAPRLPPPPGTDRAEAVLAAAAAAQAAGIKTPAQARFPTPAPTPTPELTPAPSPRVQAPLAPSSVGEAFIMGKGAPGARGGEWAPITTLMQAALPPLKSCLLNKPEGALLAPPPPAPTPTPRPVQEVVAAGMAATQANTQAAPGAGAAAAAAAGAGAGAGEAVGEGEGAAAGAAAAAGAVLEIGGGGPHLGPASPAKRRAGGVQAGTCPPPAGSSPPKAAGGQAGEAPPGPLVPPVSSDPDVVQGPAAAEPESYPDQTQAGSEKGSAAGQGAAAGAASLSLARAAPQHETHLQRVLLEAIANGSVSCGRTIQLLIQSTLLYQQVPYPTLHAATMAALGNLQAAKLITMKGGPGGGGQPASGPAAAAAGLEGHNGPPTPWSGVVLAADWLHVVYLAALECEEAFQVSGWKDWAQLLQALPDAEKRVAVAIGVSSEAAERIHAGFKASAAERARHARFAASLCLHRLIGNGELAEGEEELWGKPRGITTTGVTRGAMERLQSQLGKTAGMAAQMCAAAGWWQMETLMASLAEQAAAGARPELLALMQVGCSVKLPGITGAQAKALYAEGIRSPSQLAMANDADVLRAIVASMPRNMKATPAGKAKAKAGASKPPVKGTAAALLNAMVGSNALSNRLASKLQRAARRQLLLEAQGDLPAAGMPHTPSHQVPAPVVPVTTHESQPGSAPRKGSCNTISGHASDVSSGHGDSQAANRPPQGTTAELSTPTPSLATGAGIAGGAATPHPAATQPALTRQPGRSDTSSQAASVRGTARVASVNARTPAAVLDSIFEAMQAAILLSVRTIDAATRTADATTAVTAESIASGSTATTSAGSQLVGLVVAWSAREAAWFRLGVSDAGAVGRAARAAGDASKEEERDDDGLMYWLLCGATAAAQGPSSSSPASSLAAKGATTQHDAGSTGVGLQSITLRAVVQTVLPGYTLRVPALELAVATSAARSALMTWSCASALEGMLTRAGLWTRYCRVEAPLLLALAQAEADCGTAAPGTRTGRSFVEPGPRPDAPHSCVQLVLAPQRLLASRAWVQQRMDELHRCLRALLPQLSPLPDLGTSAGIAELCHHLRLVPSAHHPGSDGPQPAAAAQLPAPQADSSLLGHPSGLSLNSSGGPGSAVGSWVGQLVLFDNDAAVPAADGWAGLAGGRVAVSSTTAVQPQAAAGAPPDPSFVESAAAAASTSPPEPELVLVPCSCLWLHAMASGAGSLDAALASRTFASLFPVRGGDRAEGLLLLRLRLLYPSLVVLAQDELFHLASKAPGRLPLLRLLAVTPAAELVLAVRADPSPEAWRLAAAEAAEEPAAGGAAAGTRAEEAGRLGSHPPPSRPLPRKGTPGGLPAGGAWATTSADGSDPAALLGALQLALGQRLSQLLQLEVPLAWDCCWADSLDPGLTWPAGCGPSEP
ncbi:hypothetical protein QJQ45_014668 [Haematococcus lacustris]|nr:hypothetical protein QJQ45_014668 [Haematococcus lacustris]